MFYWTRGNDSVSGLDTLQLAQYTVEDHYTSVSEAVYETGESLWEGFLIHSTCFLLSSTLIGFCPSFQRQLPKAGFPLWAEEEHSVLHPRDLRPLQFACCPLMGFLLDLPFLCPSTYLHRYVAKHLFKIIIIWKKWVNVIHALHQSLPKYCGLFYMLCQVVFNCCWDFSHLLYVYCCTDIRGCYQGWHPNKHWCCIESDPPPLQGAPRTQSF